MPVEVKDIQVGYLCSPYFKDLYQYVLQNKLPSSKSAIKKLEALSKKYALLDSLLFRIYPEKETAELRQVMNTELKLNQYSPYSVFSMLK